MFEVQNEIGSSLLHFGCIGRHLKTDLDCFGEVRKKVATSRTESGLGLRARRGWPRLAKAGTSWIFSIWLILHHEHERC